MTKLRLRSRVNFPATVTGEGGFTVRKENGHWIVAPDFSDLNEITAPQLTDPTTQQVWVYNPTANSYAVLTLAGLGDALYVATSTTSLAIGTGSKAFTIQTGKDFGDGSYVIATSDANPDTDFMFGQITDYTGATLTVDVTVIGGSGTHADWTIRLAGARGITGATGASPGIQQVYSTTTADADPGNGTFRLNNATPASATAAYLDNLDSGGATVSTIFDLWDDSTNTVKGTLHLEKDTDPTVWAAFQVTGSVVDGTGYRKLTLANGAGSGAFTNGDTFAITFSRAGDKGADGTIAGSTGANDNRIIRADGTGGTTVQASAIGVDDSGNITGAGTIDVGNADTTLSRRAAGRLAVEGVALDPDIPQNSKSAAYTTVLGDANTHIYHPSSDNNPRTFTIDSNANVAYPVGTFITFVNEINTVTIAITSDTLVFAGSGSTGSRTLAANGMATALKVASTRWYISGTGLT